MLLVADEMLSGLRECEFQEALGGLPSSFRSTQNIDPSTCPQPKGSKEQQSSTLRASSECLCEACCICGEQLPADASLCAAGAGEDEPSFEDRRRAGGGLGRRDLSMERSSF